MAIPTVAAEPRSAGSSGILSPPATVTIPQAKRVVQEQREERVRSIVEGRNVAIDYYGKVVDQDDHPLAGVRVRYSIQSMYFLPWLPGGKSELREIVSDGEGLFSIRGGKGFSLGFDSLAKDGYKYSPKGGRGELYSGGGAQDYKPDPRHREIFTMVKLGSGEPLIHYDAHLSLPCDGRPVRLNVLTGALADDGDFQLTLIRTPYNIVRGGPHFSWSAKIEIIGGGLVELEGTGTYRAPLEGYNRNFTVEHPADEKVWGGGLRKVFYIKTRDERYGRIRVDLDTTYQPPPAKAFLEVCLNPSPSLRNLEYAPRK
ncbi:hypothetical protein [Chthoniobacter flavus]|nr:hypothetical protein [Chthoniobacter flavus]